MVVCSVAPASNSILGSLVVTVTALAAIKPPFVISDDGVSTEALGSAMTNEAESSFNGVDGAPSGNAAKDTRVSSTPVN